MSGNIPSLSASQLVILSDIRENNTRQFYSNMTSFFIGELGSYIVHNQVWRIAIMGETRSGKSEGGQTIAFKYVDIFNKQLKKKEFVKQIKSKFSDTGDIKIQPLEFTTKHICSSRSDYLYKLREQAKNGELVFGQIWLIDENREAGGLGSFTEKLEMDNLNNIIAKFCQCELWVQPRRFTDANTPYGVRMFKKDFINRCNWGLLYKIEMNPEGIKYNFLGWVNFPLHKNQRHRHEYELKKNEWIVKEISGSLDERAMLRTEVAKKLAKDPSFQQLRQKTNEYVLKSMKQQLVLLQLWILDKKCQNFNEAEKDMIVQTARHIWEENKNKELSD